MNFRIRERIELAAGDFLLTVPREFLLTAHIEQSEAYR